MALRTASTAMARVVRPEFLENSVSPIPTMQYLSRNDLVGIGMLEAPPAWMMISALAVAAMLSLSRCGDGAVVPQGDAGVKRGSSMRERARRGGRASITSTA